MKLSVMQVIRLIGMVVAIAGIIYALEYMNGGIKVWFWVGVLGVGFVGLLYTFRSARRRMKLEERSQERKNKKSARKPKQ